MRKLKECFLDAVVIGGATATAIVLAYVILCAWYGV